MSVTVVFEKVRAALDGAGIPCFVTGSFASSAHGIPRSTNDIDIVIAPLPQQVDSLLKQFPETDFATDPDDALQALSRRSGRNPTTEAGRPDGRGRDDRTPQRFEECTS